jgi:hypothetical protein
LQRLYFGLADGVTWITLLVFVASPVIPCKKCRLLRCVNKKIERLKPTLSPPSIHVISTDVACYLGQIN